MDLEYCRVFDSSKFKEQVKLIASRNNCAVKGTFPTNFEVICKDDNYSFYLQQFSGDWEKNGGYPELVNCFFEWEDNSLSFDPDCLKVYDVVTENKRFVHSFNRAKTREEGFLGEKEVRRDLSHVFTLVTALFGFCDDDIMKNLKTKVLAKGLQYSISCESLEVAKTFALVWVDFLTKEENQDRYGYLRRSMFEPTGETCQGFVGIHPKRMSNSGR